MPHLVVVGAGPGIAAATAQRFGADGYDVGLIARREEPLAEIGGSLQAAGTTVRWTTADAGDPAALTAAIEELAAQAGPVDVLLYNAVAGRQGSPRDLTPDQLAADLSVGVVGLQAAVLAVLPGMLARERGAGGRGTVLVTGGGAADRPFAAMASLGVQKAAVRTLVQTLAADLAADGVHVATATLAGLVGVGKQIEPDRVAALYADLVAETAGPADAWRTVVPVGPL